MPIISLITVLLSDQEASYFWLHFCSIPTCIFVQRNTTLPLNLAAFIFKTNKFMKRISAKLLSPLDFSNFMTTFSNNFKNIFSSISISVNKTVEVGERTIHEWLTSKHFILAEFPLGVHYGLVICLAIHSLFARGAGNAVSVIRSRYRETITNLLWIKKGRSGYAP